MVLAIPRTTSKIAQQVGEIFPARVTSWLGIDRVKMPARDQSLGFDRRRWFQQLAEKESIYATHFARVPDLAGDALRFVRESVGDDTVDGGDRIAAAGG